MNGLPAARIVDAVADAAERWLDADFPARVRAVRAIEARTGYTEPVVDYALDRLFGGLTRAALRATILGELGSLEALDGFVARAGRPDVFFRGVERATIVASRTTIGVALPPLAYALCAKAKVVVKDRSDGLVAAFVETVIEERPELLGSVRVEAWTGHDDPAALDALATGDIVLAFGGREALRAIRARLRPEARFVPFGPGTSAAYVSRATLDDEVSARAAAAGIARDALLYDGEGCFSAHVAFVERGGAVDAARFAAFLGAALDDAAVEFPASSAEPLPVVAAYAGSARFRAAQGSGSVRGGVGAPHLLVVDTSRTEPPPLLPRTLALYTVDKPAEATAFLREHGLALHSCALDATALRDATADAATPGGGVRTDIVAFAIASGATRLAQYGALQAPSLSGEHGGEPRILPFVRAVVRERTS